MLTAGFEPAPTKSGTDLKAAIFDHSIKPAMNNFFGYWYKYICHGGVETSNVVDDFS